MTHANGHDPRDDLDFEMLAEHLAGIGTAGAIQQRGKTWWAAVAICLAAANTGAPRRVLLCRRDPDDDQVKAAWWADFCRIASTIPRRDMQRRMVFTEYVVHYPNGSLIEVRWI